MMRSVATRLQRRLAPRAVLAAHAAVDAHAHERVSAACWPVHATTATSDDSHNTLSTQNLQRVATAAVGAFVGATAMLHTSSRTPARAQAHESSLREVAARSIASNTPPARDGSTASSLASAPSESSAAAGLAGLPEPPRARTCALSHSYDYDVVVIGGGSGGLACAREVAALGGRVALLDYVSPSPHGTTWGLGGTCVNVGCIPKKIMHTAANLGPHGAIADASEYGWELREPATVRLQWSELVHRVWMYIKGTNFGYRTSLRTEGVDFFAARGTLVDPHTVEYTETRSKRAAAAGASPNTKRISAAHIVVAVGGRPRYPEGVAGSELGITSDDLFWLKKEPGKTLLVGAGYVALECAGFLSHMNYDTSVMVRGQALRGFDQDMSERIVSHMAATGTRFLRDSNPTSLERVETERGHGIRVHWTTRSATSDGSAVTSQHNEVFDTVVFATGRGPVTAGLGLDKLHVAMDASGKIIGQGGQPGNEGGITTGGALQASNAEASPLSETSSVGSIHAVGDVLSGRPELTPVAIRAGKLLAKRIMSGMLPIVASGEKPSVTNAAAANRLSMDYRSVATTVFTPVEYACVGFSEEEAQKTFGADSIDVYHLAYDTLELAIANRRDIDDKPLSPQCYAKLIVRRGGDEPVLGMHVLGPHAGEVMQGYAVAFRKGLTKRDLEETVAIHPTHAEELILLDRTKRSGEPFLKTSC